MNQSLKSLNSKIIPTPKETPNSHLQTKPWKNEKEKKDFGVTYNWKLGDNNTYFPLGAV